MYECMILQFLVAEHVWMGSRNDKLDTDMLDRDKLDVCMYDDVCVDVPFLYMMDTGGSVYLSAIRFSC